MLQSALVWLAGWLVDGLAGWLVGWLVAWLRGCLVGWPLAVFLLLVLTTMGDVKSQSPL